MTSRPPRRQRHLSRSRSSWQWLGALLLAPWAAGCASGDKGDAPAAAAAAPPPSVADGGSLADRVEQQYVIGPAAAREMAYRVDWQYPSIGTRVDRAVVYGDSLIILDDNNYLMRIERGSGHRLWRIPAASGMDRVIGINYVPEIDRIYLTTGSALLVHDAVTGSQVDKQKLDKIANTKPVMVDQFFVYGSRNGHLVWHSYRLSSSWRGYQIAQTMNLAPIESDGYLVAIGADGLLMVLRADSATQVWSRRLLAPVVAPPVAGNGAVYVSGLDQHVRAFELRDRRSPLWAYLCESALTTSPTLIDDRLYQQIPTEGLVCFDALPLDSPGGVVLWRAPDVAGTVLTRRRGTLLTWDDETKTLGIVDERLGALIAERQLPQVDRIMATSVDAGDIFATGHDGRIIRLVAR
jgi:outer membrane protein assembly factor BamB